MQNSCDGRDAYLPKHWLGDDRSYHLLIVPMLRVGMPQWTLCVRCGCWDAERPGMHSHAERGNDQPHKPKRACDCRPVVSGKVKIKSGFSRFVQPVRSRETRLPATHRQRPSQMAPQRHVVCPAVCRTGAQAHVQVFRPHRRSLAPGCRLYE